MKVKHSPKYLISITYLIFSGYILFHTEGLQGYVSRVTAEDDQELWGLCFPSFFVFQRKEDGGDWCKRAVSSAVAILNDNNGVCLVWSLD